MLVLVSALALLTGAIEPPTLDELIETADVEDRRRIDRALISIDSRIEDILALEEELGRKAELLEPSFSATAIVFQLTVAARNTVAAGSERQDASLFASLSIDLEAIASIVEGPPIPIPSSELTRARHCSALGEDLEWIDLTALQERAHLERARALGCAWSDR